MEFYNFFNTYLGMYVAQSVLHSFLAIIVVNAALHAWRIEEPATKQRFGFIVIFASFISYPLFQYFNPERGSIFFREKALFDLDRWIGLDLLGLPVGLFFSGILVLFSALFFFQELFPILRHTVSFSRKKSGEDFSYAPPGEELRNALKLLPGKVPDVFVVNEEDFLLFSSFGSSPAVYISTGLLNSLSLEQTRAVLAHEFAHIKRSRRPVLILIFLFRILMFFNPVILLEFRRIVNEEEKICDNSAAGIAGGALALAQALEKFHYKSPPEAKMRLSAVPGMLEQYNHNLLLESRIKRLKHHGTNHSRAGWFKIVLTFCIILWLSYYIV